MTIELVAAQPRDRIALPRALLQPCGHLLKQHVAGCVAEGIVHAP